MALLVTRKSFLCCLVVSIQVWCSNSSPPTKEAYATLLYGDFLIGTRVLGQSIQNTGTQRDYLALCTDDVSEASRLVLKNEGWKIIPVKAISNMFSTAENPSQFTFTLTKLEAWTLTEYRRIILIDSDAILLKNIDHLFQCGTFCAVVRHSDLFNSGVMVIRPSTKMYKALLNKTSLLKSYDGADQGFLNSVFSDLKHATMFNPKMIGKPVEDMIMRLPAGYNMDIGMYYINGHWSLPEEEKYVLHYTLGPVKPWVWWTYPLFDLNWKWYTLRTQLPSSANDPSLVQLNCVVPVILLVTLVLCLRCLPKWKMTHLLCFTETVMRVFHAFTLPLAIAFGFTCIPTHMWPPAQGYVCLYLWTLLFLALQYTVTCSVAPRVQNRREDFVLKTGERLHHLKRAILSFLVFFTAEFMAASLIPYFVAPLLKRILVLLVLLLGMTIHSYFLGLRLVKSYLELSM